MFFLSQYFQLVQGYSPLQAGTRRTARRGGGDGVRRGGRRRRAVLVAARSPGHRAGAGRCRDGVADVGQPVHHLSAARCRPVRCRRRAGPGLHRGQRRRLRHRPRRSGPVPRRRSRRPPTRWAWRWASRCSAPSSRACTAGWRFRRASSMSLPRMRKSRSRSHTAAKAARRRPHACCGRQAAFTEGLAIAAGVGSALLLASAVAVWLLLKPCSER